MNKNEIKVGDCFKENGGAMICILEIQGDECLVLDVDEQGIGYMSADIPKLTDIEPITQNEFLAALDEAHVGIKRAAFAAIKSEVEEALNQ